MSLSHYLRPGTKLARIITATCHYEVNTTNSLTHNAKAIIVVEEVGQMGMVPWALVEFHGGENPALVNLANVESVTFAEATSGSET